MILRDVTTKDTLASTEVRTDSEFSNISFDVHGSSVILRDRRDKIQRWTLSSAHHSHRLPMDFLQTQDMEPPTMPDVSRHQYHCDERSSWVLDKENRQVLWLPHDFRRCCHGEKVAFGSANGTVTIVDFSDVRIAQLQ
jgi:hypothetical protein